MSSPRIVLRLGRSAVVYAISPDLDGGWSTATTSAAVPPDHEGSLSGAGAPGIREFLLGLVPCEAGARASTARP